MQGLVMPPIGYPGNSVSKAARAKAGGGFESAIDVLSTVFGTAQFGGSISDSEITLTTDGTFDFGAKPDADKPHTVWLAEGGAAPSSSLGRFGGWNEGQLEQTVNGEFTSSLSSDGQSQSLVYDHSTNEGAILNRVYFNSNRVYLFRRRYDDFTMAEAKILRMRMDTNEALTGTYAEVGDIITGDTSGATGEILGILVQSGGRPDWLVGNITGQFEEASGELITWATGTANARSNMNTGFNNKTIRFWSEQDAGNPQMNVYHFDGEENEGVGDPKFTVEQSPTNHLVADWANKFNQSDVAREWVNDEYLYQNNSGVDVEDGIFWWYRNGAKADEVLRYVFRTTESPNPIEWIAQAQISGGGTPGFSNRYMDILYVDTSWCRVVLIENADLTLDLNDGPAVEAKTMPCPIKSWSSSQIICADWRDYLPSATHIGVVNAENELVALSAIGAQT